MSNARPSSPRLADLEVYDPKYLPADVLLSANEYPEAYPQDLQEELIASLKEIAFNRYPDPLAKGLRAAVGALYGLEEDWVLLGNGGDELLFDFALAWGDPGRKFLTCPPTFSVYNTMADLCGTSVVEVNRTDTYDVDKDAVVGRLKQGDIDYAILTSPNNPTGNVISNDDIVEILQASNAIIMVDEAYAEFADGSAYELLRKYDNLLILRTFSKAFGMAGVRLGYVLGNPQLLAELIKVRQPYSVDAISQALGLGVMKNRDRFDQRIDAIKSNRQDLETALKSLPGVTVFPSEANFLLIKVKGAHEIWEELLERGVLVRDFSQKPLLRDCLRITVGNQEQNQRLLDTLRSILELNDNNDPATGGDN